MNDDHNIRVINALGEIEGYKNDILLLKTGLKKVPLWRPGAVLIKKCNEVIRVINGLEKRIDKKLVITIIGPCGSGKSTLLNVLAGVDGLSKMGNKRPTTRDPLILCEKKSDARQLIQSFGSEKIKIRSSNLATSLKNILLIDTPDADSTEQKHHVDAILKAISHSDVLICVFNAENPKTRDHADFMASFVKHFEGESLVAVLNRCDRLSETEIKESILPDFLNFIQKAWDRSPSTVFCISARAHLNNPNWDPNASPRHNFDQFDDLKQMVLGRLSQAGYAVDRRVENTRHLKEYIFSEAQKEITKDKQYFVESKKKFEEAEKAALKDAVIALKSGASNRIFGINVLLYQKIANKWLGPMGWIIAIWARLLIFGTGIVSMFRFGNPLRQILGVVSSLRRFKSSRAAVEEADNPDKVDVALRSYRWRFLKEWPDISGLLVKGRFDESIRGVEKILPENGTLDHELSMLWSEFLEIVIEKKARSLSNWFMQIIFNLPPVAIMGHVGWVTSKEYLIGNYLSSDYFLHAFLVFIIALFLSFFIFQTCVRIYAKPDRLTLSTFENVKNRVDLIKSFSKNPVVKQLDHLLIFSGKKDPSG